MRETREAIALDHRAQQRLYVLVHVLAGELTVAEASRVLHLSGRTVRRQLAAYRADGAAGLVHGDRGRSPAHRTPDPLRDRLVALATTTYAEVNRAHLAELLAEREHIVIANGPCRGSWPRLAWRRPGPAGRRSRHQWFGPSEPFATRIGVVDDATSRRTGATFRAQEDAAGYFAAFAQTATRYGLPGAV